MFEKLAHLWQTHRVHNPHSQDLISALISCAQLLSTCLFGPDSAVCPPGEGEALSLTLLCSRAPGTGTLLSKYLSSEWGKEGVESPHGEVAGFLAVPLHGHQISNHFPFLLCARDIVCINNLISTLRQFSGLGTVMIPCLQIRKLRPREVKTSPSWSLRLEAEPGCDLWTFMPKSRHLRLHRNRAAPQRFAHLWVVQWNDIIRHGNWIFLNLLLTYFNA